MWHWAADAIAETKKHPPKRLRADLTREQKTWRRRDATNSRNKKLADQEFKTLSKDKVGTKTLGDAKRALQRTISETGTSLGKKIKDLTNTTKAMARTINTAVTKADQALKATADLSKKHTKLSRDCLSDRQDHGGNLTSLNLLGSGNCVQHIGDDVTTKEEEVTVAALHASPSTTLLEHEMVVTLAAYFAESGSFTEHTDLGFDLTPTPAEAVADADVGAPAVVDLDDASATIAYSDGVLRLKVTPDCDDNTTKTYQAGTKSTGSITCVAKANLIDGETVTLEDAKGTSKVFEFDVAGDGVTAGRVQVDVSGDTTATEVAATLAAAINGSVLRMTATPSAAVVNLEQDDALAAGNTTIAETVADAGFTVVSFSGGVDRDEYTVTVDVSGVALLANVPDFVYKWIVVA